MRILELFTRKFHGLDYLFHMNGTILTDGTILTKPKHLERPLRDFGADNLLINLESPLIKTIDYIYLVTALLYDNEFDGIPLVLSTDYFCGLFHSSNKAVSEATSFILQHTKQNKRIVKHKIINLHKIYTGERKFIYGTHTLIGHMDWFALYKCTTFRFLTDSTLEILDKYWVDYENNIFTEDDIKPADTHFKMQFHNGKLIQ